MLGRGSIGMPLAGSHYDRAKRGPEEKRGDRLGTECGFQLSGARITGVQGFPYFVTPWSRRDGSTGKAGSFPSNQWQCRSIGIEYHFCLWRVLNVIPGVSRLLPRIGTYDLPRCTIPRTRTKHLGEATSISQGDRRRPPDLSGWRI